MKILVCLVSRQHIPNLMSVHAVKPDRLALMVSKKMISECRYEHLLYALEKGGLNYQCKKDLIYVDDENSVASASLALDEYLEGLKQDPDNEIIVNITGGTKPLSIGAFIVSEKKRLKMLYISESDQTKALDLKGEKLPLDHKITIAEFLGGYGYKVFNEKEMIQAEEDAQRTTDLAANLASKIGDKSFWESLSKLNNIKKDNEDNSIHLCKENGICITDAVLRDKIASQFGLSVEESCLIGKLSGRDALFLAGKWLEVFIWKCLCPLVGSAIWDLHLGCKFGTNDLKGKVTDNEWDVIFIRDQSLCIIECKTGELSQYSSSGSDLIYEIAGIKSQLQALRVKTFLATTSDKVKDKEETVKKDLLLRSKVYDCDIIPSWEIRNLASLFLTQDRSLSKNVYKTFFKNQVR